MKKVLAFLENLCYTKQVPNARVQNKHKKLIWLRGQAVKTLASHAGIRGSIPLGVTGIHRINLWIFFYNRKCNFLLYKKPPAGCALRRILKMSQATTAGARMCLGTFFVL